jgi:hypothetical protein
MIMLLQWSHPPRRFNPHSSRARLHGLCKYWPSDQQTRPQKAVNAPCNPNASVTVFLQCRTCYLVADTTFLPTRPSRAPRADSAAAAAAAAPPEVPVPNLPHHYCYALLLPTLAASTTIRPAPAPSAGPLARSRSRCSSTRRRLPRSRSRSRSCWASS